MKLDEFVAWYQKKIGTYDKQQWEKTVEQRILSGFTNIPLKNTKLRTEFIDVDLVRGSTFPKAKAKQSLLTVLRLAILRFLFLPLYAKWWVAQTSPKIFSFLLFLYTLQMFNWAVYSYNVNRLDGGGNKVDDTCSAAIDTINKASTPDEPFVTLTELMIPMCLCMTLSLIHSQIVATSSASVSKSEKRKRDIVQPNRKKRERKKRKKHVRVRSSLNAPVGSDTKQSLKAVNSQKGQVAPDLISFDNYATSTSNDCSPPPLLKRLSTNDVVQTEASPIEVTERQIRKRNVYWDSSIKSPASNKAEPRSVNGATNDYSDQGEPNRSLHENNAVAHTTGDDDGFESLNGKSSSGEDIPLSNSAVNQIKESASNGPDYRKSLTMSGKFGSKADSSDTDEEDDDNESSPLMNQQFTEGTTSATEWIGITTNSEECSYSSADNSESQIDCSENGTECDFFTPTVILNSSCEISDRISCTIWDGRETKKAEMSVLDISSVIIERVEAIPETCDYVYIGLAFSIVLSLVPAFCRICEAVINSTESNDVNFLDMPALLLEKTSFSHDRMLQFAFGESAWQKTVLFIDFLLRLFLTFLFFFLLTVAERTFKQRFLYAKLFSHLTSSRRARKSELPHFRLNKVRNIKTWLSVRSYLKRRGPQRSVDIIVSAAFILTFLLLAFLSVEWLKDSVQLQSQHNLEALIWSCALGCFLLRFMTLGTKINRKYRSISVLITEQINLYLQIEQKPHNKDELMVSNSVLKLAADLLKELESPFKISGLSANPYLYTTVKVVILSALSGVLSEMLGFKLKLHKIKIK